jgi:hypothetical protein
MYIYYQQECDDYDGYGVNNMDSNNEDRHDNTGDGDDDDSADDDDVNIIIIIAIYNSIKKHVYDTNLDHVYEDVTYRSTFQVLTYSSTHTSISYSYLS